MTPNDLGSLPADMPPTRRTVVTAGAWSLPILATAVAAPMAAASREPRVDPTVYRVSSAGSETQPFDQAPLRYQSTQTSASSAIYQDNTGYNTRIYIRNNGPDTMPAGAKLAISSNVYPAAGSYINISAFQTGTSALGINSSTMPGAALTFSGPADNIGGSMNRVFTINRPIPSGSEFMIQIEFNIGQIGGLSQGGIGVSITPPTGTVDTNTGNNQRRNSGDPYYVS